MPVVFRRVVLWAAALAAIFGPERVSAQPVDLIDGQWFSFEYFDAFDLPSAVEGDGFAITVGLDQQLRFRVTDFGVSGDRFNLFANGLFVGSTSVVPAGVDTEIFDGDLAFNSGALSTGEFLLGAGSYTFTLQVTETGSGFDFGEGAVRADLLQIDDPPPPTVVPEPATVWLMGSSLFALALVTRLRVRQQRRA